jgi:hypothetical protein
MVDIGHAPVLEAWEIANQWVINMAEGDIVVVALAIVRLPRAIALGVLGPQLQKGRIGGIRYRGKARALSIIRGKNLSFLTEKRPRRRSR